MLISKGARIALGSGLDCNDHRAIWAALDKVRAKHPNMALLDGSSPKGAEHIAALWCRERVVGSVEFKSDWAKHRDAASFKRNDQLLEVMPVGVLVFPGDGVSPTWPARRARLGHRSCASTVPRLEASLGRRFSGRRLDNSTCSAVLGAPALLGKPPARPKAEGRPPVGSSQLAGAALRPGFPGSVTPERSPPRPSLGIDRRAELFCCHPSPTGTVELRRELGAPNSRSRPGASSARLCPWKHPGRRPAPRIRPLPSA